MTVQGFLWIAGAALTTIASNVILRMGVLRAGGFGVSGKGLAADIMSLAGQPLFLLGMGLYGMAALIWFYIVSTQELATAYVLLVAMAFIGVTTVSHFAFGEAMGPMKILGLLVVLTGIVITSRA
jgi:multidrug transporter EmrE-like cation transporter